MNQAPLDTGLYVAFAICFVFFVVAVFAMLWAFKNGDFEDIESTKFDMLDDSPEGAVAQKAREAVERARETRS